MLSFAAFYEEVHPRLIASLAALCGDVDLAADAADEAAVRAIERWDRVAVMANPQGWLFRVAVHEVRRRQRRRSLEQRLLRRSAPLTGAIPGPTGEIWALVAGLGHRQREAIVLRHIAQMTEPEIALAMGVTRGTVSSTLRAAHRRLRTLAGDDPVAPRAHPLEPRTENGATS